MINLHELVGENIRIVREELGYRTKDLSDWLHIDENQIMLVEEGKLQLGFEELYTLARMFNVSANIFLKEGLSKDIKHLLKDHEPLTPKEYNYILSEHKKTVEFKKAEMSKFAK